MKTIPSPPTVAYTTNQNIFKTMDRDSLVRNMANYIKVLKDDRLSPEERAAYEVGYNLCKQEFDK